MGRRHRRHLDQDPALIAASSDASTPSAPGPYYPYTFLWAASIDSFDAVHLHSGPSGVVLRMGVSHSHPSPKTYVAAGRCNGGC